MKEPIIKALDSAGLQEDCPFAKGDSGPEILDSDSVKSISDKSFMEYVGCINQYLQVIQ